MVNHADAPDSGLSVSAIIALRQHEWERQGVIERRERNLLASWRRLAQPFAVSLAMAGERLREERLMGLRPPMRLVSMPALTAAPAVAMDAAAGGEHVTVTDETGRAVVLVSAAEYDRLRLDRRLLMWEGTDGPAPRGGDRREGDGDDDGDT